MDIEQVTFKDLIDLNELKLLFEKFSAATGFTTSLIDHATNEVLVGTGWRDICVKFHRACPESQKHCKTSNKELTSGLHYAGEIRICHCENGLIDGCTPIIIQDKHFANLCTGQVLFAPPDKEIFRKQAQKYNYDEQEYMNSLAKVPVVSEEKFSEMLHYLAHTASMIAQTGLANITSRKESTGKEALLQSIFKSAPVGIGLVVNRVFQWTNERMTEITGYTSAELKGQTARMLYPSQEEFEKVGREKYTQINECGTGSVDTRFKRKDGSIVDVHLSSTPIDQHNLAAGVTFTALDITNRKKAEEELFQVHKMEAIGTLAGGIAHDFNNILSAIMGYSEIAKLNIPSDSNAIKDIDQVLKASQRAADLVQQILTFSRKSNHRLEPIAPNLIIKEALKMMRSSLPATINILENIDNECGKIMADPTNIHQILVNLCTNSLHAIEDEKGVISVNLQRKKIRAEEINEESGVSPGPFIVLEVSDTGQGIEQTTIDHIFDPYFTTKEVGKGTGLGLSVVHGIIQDYHGFIRVESEPGKGTTFRVHIPVLQQETPTPDESETDEPLPTGTEHILVVDDESLIANIDKALLEQLGYEVTAITQSHDALEQIRTDPDQFDLIITDQTMPNLTGAELAKEILSIRPDMPIILCTGYSSVFSEEGALAIGIKKYAKKPVDRTTLAKIVRQVLDEK